MKKLAILGGPKLVNSKSFTWPEDFLLKSGDKELEAVTGVINRAITWGTYAPEVSRLEKGFSEFIGVQYALATNSGAAALHCAVEAAGIGAGDEVITSPHTFIGTVTGLILSNAIPVFADINIDTYNIDPKAIEEKITKRTKAIMPVHLYGLPADMDPINKIAKSHGLVVIEDACQAHGATYKGRKAGALGDMAGFSLNASKNMMAGEGGIFTTNSTEYAEEAKKIRVFGEVIKPDEPREYKALRVGSNYRITELQSALANVQLERLSETNRIRIENANYLTSRLEKIPGFITPHIPSDSVSVYYMYKIRVDPDSFGIKMNPKELRSRVVTALKAEGVPASIWSTEPIYMQPLFQNRNGHSWHCPSVEEPVVYREGDCPNTEKASQEAFNINVHPPNDITLVAQWADGFEKVFENANELGEIPESEIYLWEKGDEFISQDHSTRKML